MGKMRRDGGCGKRGAGLVKGRQGHDAGATIDADDMRPLIEMSGQRSTDDPEPVRTQPCSVVAHSFGGPIGRGSVFFSLPRVFLRAREPVQRVSAKPEAKTEARFPPPPSRTNVAKAMLVKRLRRTCLALMWPEATPLSHASA